MKMHFGIDYGAKSAGTTVICYNKDNKLHLLSSVKKQDSDAFISQKIDELKPSAVYIDAPLSIPAAYFNKGNNYHYRKCDIECKAMSPMFLGGLTARAMKLSKGHPSLDFFETYPSYFIREILSAKDLYHKKDKIVNKEIIALIEKLTAFKLADPIENYHQLDSMICWLSGKRHIEKKHLTIGEKFEGQIIV